MQKYAGLGSFLGKLSEKGAAKIIKGMEKIHPKLGKAAKGFFTEVRPEGDVGKPAVMKKHTSLGVGAGKAFNAALWGSLGLDAISSVLPKKHDQQNNYYYQQPPQKMASASEVIKEASLDNEIGSLDNKDLVPADDPLTELLASQSGLYTN